MRNSSCVLMVTMLLAAPAAYAEELAGEGHEAHHRDVAQTPAATQDKTPAPGMATLPMREQMRAVRERMRRIQENEDSDELLDLLEDHVESLLDMMKMMHGMMAAQAVMEQGMMGGHKGGMGMMGGKKGGMGMMGGHHGGMGKMGGGKAGMGMMGGEKGGMGKMGGGMMGGKGGMMMGMMATHQAMVARMNMMEKRLNMMQMMMDQMLQNQGALVDHLEDRLEEKAAKE